MRAARVHRGRRRAVVDAAAGAGPRRRASRPGVAADGPLTHGAGRRAGRGGPRDRGARLAVDRRRQRSSGRAARWFGLTLIWTTLALAVAASGLATVIPRLPNDHYHAFADPIVFVAVGMGVAGLVRGSAGAAARPGREGARRRRGGARSSSRSSPSTSPVNRRPSRPMAAGPAGTRPRNASCGPSAARTRRRSCWRASPTSSRPTRSDSRSPGGAQRIEGGDPATDPLVVLCDALFVEAIGAPCGGPAEDALVGATGNAPSSIGSRPLRTAGSRSTCRNSLGPDRNERRRPRRRRSLSPRPGRGGRTGSCPG